MLNIPLVTDQTALALRVAAYRFDNAGYVDAVSTPALEATATATGSTVILEDDIGGSTFTGARAILLWSATEELDVTLTLGTQEIDVDGAAELATGQGYRANYLNTPNGMNEAIEFDYGNLLIEYDLGWASLMSATSVFKGETAFNQNFSTQAPGSGFDAVSFNTYRDVDRFVEEVRLASQLEGPWQFVAGLFYEDLQDDLRPIRLFGMAAHAANFFGC